MLMTNVAGLVNPALKPPGEEHSTEYAPNGDPVLSPSQVSKFLMCPRKWAAQYIHGQHEPVGASAEAGKAMHSLLETYYKKGTVPTNTTPAGVWAQALMKHTDLPLPNPRAKTPFEGPIAERRFKFEHDGVWWRGSKDLTYVRDGRYIIRDHKSTSDLNPLWVKSGSQLLTDPQSVIYAFEAYLTDDPDQVENEWGYVTRDKYPKTDLHRAEMTWDVTWRGMGFLTQVGLEMLRHYRSRPALNDLPPEGASNGGCEAFRGCKVIGCSISALDRIKGQQLFNARKQGGVDMSPYLEQLKARQATQAALSGASAPASTPPPAADPAPVVDIRTRLANAAGAGASVVPPPYTPPVAVAPAVAPAVEQAPAPVPITEAPRRGRGRARAAAPAPVPTPVPVLQPAQQLPDEIVKALTKATYAAGITPGTADGYTLYVNCAPMGEPLIMFSHYSREIHAAIKEAKGWDHYALASFDGTAAFQDALQQYLQQSPPVGNLVVDSRTNEGRDALPMLERFALGKPVRGF